MAKTSKETYEICSSYSGAINTGQYENRNPFYSVKKIIDGKKLSTQEIANEQRELAYLCRCLWTEEYREIKGIKTPDVKFTEIDGKKYYHVTAILGYLHPIDFPPEKLDVYAKRGTLVHKQIEDFFEYGEITPLKEINADLYDHCKNNEHVKLNPDDCNFSGFWEKHGDDFDVLDIEKFVTSELGYCGTFDMKAEFNGKLGIFDFKTSSSYGEDKKEHYFKQMAAYSLCEAGIECLGIFPLNPKNKSGYGAPIITQDVTKYQKLWLKDLERFQNELPRYVK